MNRGHVPIRTCLGCRQRKPKQELLRFAAGPSGLEARTLGGRGRYVCRDASCLTRTLKRKDIGSLIGGPLTNEKLQAIVTMTTTKMNPMILFFCIILLLKINHLTILYWWEMLGEG